MLKVLIPLVVVALAISLPLLWPSDIKSGSSQQSRPFLIERVSVASDGTEGNNSSSWPAITANGRFVTFYSDADNLVPEERNGAGGIFIHDMETGVTLMVGIGGPGSSVSADGRYVAFESRASNLVPEDTNGAFDIFVYDRQSGVTERISVTSDGTQATNGLDSTPTTTPTGQPGPTPTYTPPAHSRGPVISSDGRFVAFTSDAFDLVPGDTNHQSGFGTDVFVHDRQTGKTERVSVASDGSEANNYSTGSLSISDDGRFIAFGSLATNLVPEGTTGQTNVFLHDRETGVTELAAIASDGTVGDRGSFDGRLSRNGRYILFRTSFDGVWGSYIRDLETGITDLINPALATDGYESTSISISDMSADGRFALVNNRTASIIDQRYSQDENVYVYDHHTGETALVSMSMNGSPGNDDSLGWSISADGSMIVFQSYASDLVPGDTNGGEHPQASTESNLF